MSTRRSAQRQSAAQSVAATEATAAAQTPTPAPAEIAPDLLGALRALLSDDIKAAIAQVQAATPAPAPAPAPAQAAPLPKPQERRISMAEFAQLHPESLDDLKAAVLGTVFVTGGSWGAFREAVLGR